AARTVLLERFGALTAKRRRDADGLLSWLLLRALRDLVTGADVPLLLEATRTFEHVPPSFDEVAHGIRADGLHRLLELDGDLARWRAIEMLADGQDNPVTGEPARTALRVLGSAGELTLLYGIALDNPYGLPPAARAESLLWLDGLPDDRLRPVIDRFLEKDEPNLLLPVIELGIERRVGWLEDVLINALLATSHVDAFRYAILQAIARHRLDLVERIRGRLDSKTGRKDRRTTGASGWDVGLDSLRRTHNAITKRDRARTSTSISARSDALPGLTATAIRGTRLRQPGAGAERELRLHKRWIIGP